MNRAGRPRPGVRAANRDLAQRLQGLHPVAAARLRETAELLERGDVRAAELALLGAAIRAPEHPEMLRWSGAVQSRLGHHQRAIEEFQRALAVRPDDMEVSRLLAAAHYELNQHERALAVLREASASASTPFEWLSLGLELDRQGYVEEALALSDRVLQAEDHNVQARLLRARCLYALGRVDDAAAEYRTLIARRQEAAASWYAMIDQKTVRIDAAELAALARAEAESIPGSEASCMLSFALGKAYEDAGEYARAFDALARANASARAQNPWDAKLFRARVDAVREAFARPYARADVEQGSEVIFVVGLPRSGTTLIEQVLAAHPEVEGASELPYLNRVIGEESARRKLAFPQWVPTASASDWARLGRRYLQASARWRKQHPRSTDKLPANWLLAGAVMAMLPGARIVGMKRDPLETCWSCYKQLFAPGLVGFAYDFESLASYWRDYDRLSRFWAELEPERFRIQSYEAFVADPDAQVRELLQFCGLPFDESCLRFNEAQRSVRTASAAQVRQPLRKDTARTARYGELMAPLRALLQQRGAFDS